MMQHLDQVVVFLFVVSTVGHLTSGQPTVDSELMNQGCDSGDYSSVLKELSAGQRRVESQLQLLKQQLQQQQQQGCSGNSDTGNQPRESSLNV